MAFYKIAFTIDGVRHFTNGTSSYPSNEDIENNTWSEPAAMTNVGMFISGYKEAKGINKDKKVYDIYYEIHTN